MFTSKDNKLRHRILKEFYETTKQVKVLNYGTKGITISIKDSARHHGVTPKKIEDVCELLYANGDIEFGSHSGNDLGIVSTDKSVSAYLEKKYLNASWEKFKKSTDFWIKWTAVISLGLALFTTINTCNKSQDNKQDIQLLQRQINELKGKANTLPQ